MPTIEGLDKFIAEFKNFQEDGNRMFKAIVQSSGDEIVAKAKQLAPSDLGAIRQNIVKLQTEEGYSAEITSNAPESAYQEFGTGPRVQIPPELADEAAKFKGGGENKGNWEDFIKALTEWIRRKGIVSTYSVATRKRSRGKNSTGDAAEQFAYVFARSILKKGLKPQPFLYPAWVEVVSKLPERLQAGINRLKA